VKNLRAMCWVELDRERNTIMARLRKVEDRLYNPRTDYTLQGKSTDLAICAALHKYLEDIESQFRDKINETLPPIDTLVAK
jgi:hypothetical protein